MMRESASGNTTSLLALGHLLATSTARTGIQDGEGYTDASEKGPCMLLIRSDRRYGSSLRIGIIWEQPLGMLRTAAQIFPPNNQKSQPRLTDL
jgi:hypothetical protein